MITAGLIKQVSWLWNAHPDLCPIWFHARESMKVFIPNKAVSTCHVSEPFAIDRERFAAGCPCPHGVTRVHTGLSVSTRGYPCPHGVTRVHTGGTGTLVPGSRDQERAGTNRSRSVAFCRLCRVDARVGANQQQLSHASLAYFFRDMGNFHTWHPRFLVFDTHISKYQYVVASCHNKHWFVEDSINLCFFTILEAKHRQKNIRWRLRSRQIDIGPGQISIAFACVFAFLADFCWIAFFIFCKNAQFFVE